jgi:hypothetical protein
MAVDAMEAAGNRRGSSGRGLSARTCALVLAAWQVWAVTAAAAPDVSVEDVVARVRQRQTRTPSFTYVVRCRQTLSGPGRGPSAEPARVKLTVQDGKLRCDLDDRTGLGGGGMPLSDHSVSGAYAEGVATLHRRGTGRGSISWSPNRVREDPRVKPLLYAHCLFDALSNVTADQVHVAGRGVHDERTCVIVERRRYTDLDVVYRNQWWLDEGRDYCVVLARSLHDNSETRRAEIQYAYDKRSGWRVSSFKDTTRDAASHRIRYTIDCEVLRAEFGVEVPERTFRVEFPPGTVVLNRFTGVEYTAGEETPELTGLLDEGRMEEFVEAAREQVGGRFDWEPEPPRRPWTVVGAVAVALALLGGGAAYWRSRRLASRVPGGAR